jgi:hypothetical protein
MGTSPNWRSPLFSTQKYRCGKYNDLRITLSGNPYTMETRMARRETKYRNSKERRKEKPKERRTRHHRLPRSLGGGHGADNISLVYPEPHRAYHRIFGAGIPHEVCWRLNNMWLPISTTVLPIPTRLLHSVLHTLKEAGVEIDINTLGLTPAHRKIIT